MQKKKLFSWSQKELAHPQKRREGGKEREFFLGAEALQVHYIMGMESSIPA